MIKIENLSHEYKKENGEAIKKINLHIKKGENVVIIGSSGSGKSTLLKCINRLINPTSGKILIDNEDIVNSHPKKAEKIRGNIGMIFQNFNLVERDTVLKNILNGRLRFNSSFNTLINRFSKEDIKIVKESIHTVGLEKFQNERVCNLSGGQKQRVAIARTLSQKPEIILADEPVSNLDPQLMMEIMDLLKKICEEKEITLVSSLHFLDFAKRYGSRIIGMRNGEIVFDDLSENLSEREVMEIYKKV